MVTLAISKSCYGESMTQISAIFIYFSKWALQKSVFLLLNLSITLMHKATSHFYNRRNLTTSSFLHKQYLTH